MTSYAFAETPQPKTTDEALNKLAKAHKITKPEDVEDYKQRVRQHIAELKQIKKGHGWYVLNWATIIAGAAISVNQLNGSPIQAINHIIHASFVAFLYGGYTYLRPSPELDCLDQKLKNDVKK